MAVQSRVNYLGGQRIDLPDLLAADSYNINDIRSLLTSLAGNSSFVLSGLEVTGWNGLQVSVNIANSLILCPNNTVAPFYKGQSGDADLTATLQASSEIYLELVLETTTSSPISRGFWDPLAVTADSAAGSEFTETVDSQVIIVPKLVQRFGGFTSNSIKIAKITTGPSEITEVVDSRELFFRLGTGGALPDPFAQFAWDESTRQEPPTTSTSAGQLDSTNSASIYYANTINGTILNDKGIKSFKEWLNAIMTIVKEIKGTSTWYQDAASSSGYPLNLSLLTLFLDSQAGHSISATPSATIYWRKNGISDTTLKSEGTSTIQWQTNYGSSVKWQLGGTYSSNRIYSSVNFVSPSIADGDSLYLPLERNVLLTSSAVEWKPTSSPGGSLDATKSVVGLSLFIGVAVGDYIRKESDGILSYYRVEKLLYNDNSTSTIEGTVANSTVKALELSREISSSSTERYKYFRSRYSSADLIVRGPSSPVPANDVDWYWIGRRTGDEFYLRDYGNLSTGEEVEVIEPGAQDIVENDFGTEPILALDPDVAFSSANILGFNPTLSLPVNDTVYLTLYKRKTKNRTNSNSPDNPGILTYQMNKLVTLTTGQELWVKLSDDYSASPYALTSGDVTDTSQQNVFQVRDFDDSPLKNYDNKQVFMLAKRMDIGSKTYMVFFDGTAVGDKGRATPQRLQVEDVWLHDTDVDVTSTATPARLFENANEIQVGSTTTTTKINGSQVVKRTDVSGTYSAQDTDYILSVDTSAASATINLPAISTVSDGFLLIVKDKSGNSYTNTITVNSNGSDTVENTASFVIQSDNASFTFVANATTNNWEVI